MKKIALAMLVSLSMGASAGLYAQNSAADKTKQVISSIPALNTLSHDIEKFESKISGKTESYKNAAADLKALKQKFANELTVQISSATDTEIKNILSGELKKVNTEIANLK